MIESCAEKTYAATTIADIVRRAGISRTTFYKRFSGKRECFNGALDYCVDELRTAAADSHTASDSPSRAVCKAVAAVLRVMATRPALAQLVVGEAVTVEPTVIERYRQLLIPAAAGLWGATADPRGLHADPRLAFGRAQVLIFNQVVAGNAKELSRLLPEIVYLAVLPFAGHEEALDVSRLAKRGADVPPGPGGG